MKVKRILCMLLVLFVCAAAMSTKANAEYTSGDYGDWEYHTFNGEVTIEDYNGSAAKVTVPSEI